jgi:hypothetical protein|nr:hypothetical protein [uncultured Defluviimonas sp.]
MESHDVPLDVPQNAPRITEPVSPVAWYHTQGCAAPFETREAVRIAAGL